MSKKNLKPINLQVPDHQRIRDYAEASGDLNPLHVDPVVARAAGFPDVIAHGMLVMGLAMSSLRAAMNSRRIKNSSVRFTAPVLAGTALVLTAEIEETEVSFSIRNSDNVVVLVGTASVG